MDRPEIVKELKPLFQPKSVAVSDAASGLLSANTVDLGFSIHDGATADTVDDLKKVRAKLAGKDAW